MQLIKEGKRKQDGSYETIIVNNGKLIVINRTKEKRLEGYLHPENEGFYLKTWADKSNVAYFMKLTEEETKELYHKLKTIFG